MIIKVERYLEPVMQKFIDYVHEQLGALDQAIKDGNLKEIKRVGHTLKGTCGGYGFEHLSALSKSLEELDGKDTSKRAADIVAQMRQSLQESEIEYVGEA